MKKLILFLAISAVFAACGQNQSPKTSSSQSAPTSVGELIASFIAENGGTGYEPYSLTVVDSVYSKTGELVLCGFEHYYSVTNKAGERMDTTKAWFAVTPDLSEVMYMTGIAWDYNDWKDRFTR